MATLKSMTKEKLVEYAESVGVETTPSMTKKEILELLTNNGVSASLEPEVNPVEEAPRSRSGKRMRGGSFRPQRKSFRESDAPFTIEGSDRFSRKRGQSEYQMIKNEIVSSKNNKNICLTGVVNGWRLPDDENNIEDIYIRVMYKSRVLVIIRAVDFFPADIKDFSRLRLIKYLSARNGSKVDFVVNRVEEDPEAEALVAFGSRKIAMRNKAAMFWGARVKNPKTPEQKWAVRAGKMCEARVVTVTAKGIWIEIAGKETFIENRELDYSFIADARSEFKNGEEIIVKLESVERDEKGNVTNYTASRKACMKNPLTHLIYNFQKGERLYGTVAEYRTDDIDKVPYAFVNVDNQIDIYCKLDPRLDRVPAVGDNVTIVIDKVNIDELWIKGSIIFVNKRI